MNVPNSLDEIESDILSYIVEPSMQVMTIMCREFNRQPERVVALMNKYTALKLMFISYANAVGGFGNGSLVHRVAKALELPTTEGSSLIKIKEDYHVQKE